MVVCPPGVLPNPGQLLGACTTQLAPDTLLQLKRVGQVLAAGTMCFAFSVSEISAWEQTEQRLRAEFVIRFPVHVGEKRNPPFHQCRSP